jgi:hypothetical protein
MLRHISLNIFLKSNFWENHLHNITTLNPVSYLNEQFSVALKSFIYLNAQSSAKAEFKTFKPAISNFVLLHIQKYILLI